VGISGRIIRHGGMLFTLYGVGAFVGLLLIRSTFNGGFYFSVKVLAVPAALLVVAFVHQNRAQLLSPWRKTAMIYPMLLVFTWPYVMMLNASHVSGRVLFDGPVVEKFTSGSLGSKCHIRIRDRHSGELVAFAVSARVFGGTEVGSDFHACFLKGLFGIPFLWRSNPAPAECRDSGS
jgi:hypothetical protein